MQTKEIDDIQEEYESIRSRSQFVTLNKGRGSNIKYMPKAYRLYST